MCVSALAQCLGKSNASEHALHPQCAQVVAFISRHRKNLNLAVMRIHSARRTPSLDRPQPK
jgi:hypothetical protein